MFDLMHNGWAERDAAQRRHEERLERIESYSVALRDELLTLATAHGRGQKQRDEAMEGALNWIFSNPEEQQRFEGALLQHWAKGQVEEGPAQSTLALVLDRGLNAFIETKAQEHS